MEVKVAKGRPYPVGFILGTVVFGLGCLLCQLLLPLRTSSKEDVVDKGILQKGQEHKDKAAHEVHVNGFDVGNFRQCLPQVCVNGGHCQDGCDSCMKTRRVSGRAVPRALTSLLLLKQLKSLQRRAGTLLCFAESQSLVS